MKKANKIIRDLKHLRPILKKLQIILYNHLHNQNRAVILVTHYERLLDYVKPDFVHVLIHGKIILSGGPEQRTIFPGPLLDDEEAGLDEGLPAGGDVRCVSH